MHKKENKMSIESHRKIVKNNKDKSVKKERVK